MRARKKGKIIIIMKKIKRTNFGFKPVSPFKTYEEEANFWDTHDLTELWDPKSIKFTKGGTLIANVDPKKVKMAASLTIRLQPVTQRNLEAVASQKGLNVSSLARMWLTERLATVKAIYAD